jgi:hypothetical protein
MKHLTLFVTASLLILLNSFFITVYSQKTSDDHFENKEWNGSITYTYRTSSKNSGPYSEWVYKEHDITSALRMQASIANGKGTAVSTYTSKSVTRHRETVAGKTYETEDKHEGSGNGTKATELEIGVDEDNKTYNITVPAPGFTGMGTRTYSCKGCDYEPSSSTYAVGGEESMIMVEDQKLGKNPNVLTGEITKRTENENGEVSETIIRWSFMRGPIDVELIVRPHSYAAWMPLPGKDEHTEGDRMLVGLELKNKDGKAPRLKVTAFELRLSNTSKEPGLAINYPLTTAASATFDLRFMQQEGATVGEEQQFITIPAADGESGIANIGSFDGGGYAVLEVEAILEGGIRVKGHLETGKGPTAIEIPKRAKGTRIAQAWLDKFGRPGETDDMETTAGTANKGDGLTVYEEYRGVFSDGRYMRLDPTKKELGIQMKKEERASFSQGISLFAKATGLTVVPFIENELGEDRQLNKNSSYTKAGIQHALRLEKQALAGGIVGENQPSAMLYKTPAGSVRTVVDIEQIQRSYASQKAALLKAGATMPNTVAEEIASTIAHELSHGVYIKHHGEKSDEFGREIYENSNVVFELYDSDGALIKLGKEPFAYPYKVKGAVGKVGCDASGDLSCIMAYTSAYQWSYAKDAKGALVYRAVPLLPHGKHLCTSATGTGINANGFFGNAEWGNCLSQLKVKDY